MRSVRQVGVVVVFSLVGFSGALLGCESEAVKKCHAQMASSQALLLAMDSKDATNVKEVLGSIEDALGICVAAKRADEVRDLREAKSNLSGHLKAVEAQAARGAPHRLSPEEIDRLVKTGDPSCPKGQAYQHGDSKKVIQCAGPQLFEMNLDQVVEHFGRRGFSVAIDPKGEVVRAESGAELFVFRFGEPQSKKGATCLTITAPPGVPWQEVATRTTGVPPQKIVEGKPLIAAGKSIPLRLEGPGPDKTLHLGLCPAPGPEGAPQGASPP